MRLKIGNRVDLSLEDTIVYAIEEINDIMAKAKLLALLYQNKFLETI